MAWTTPKTWAFQEGVESAELNIHLRDNLNAIGAHQRIRKTADQSVTSSTVLVNDTHLSFAIAASEIWAVTFTLFYGASSVGDLKVGLTVPAAATGSVGQLGAAVAVVSSDPEAIRAESSQTVTTALSFGGIGTTNHLTAHVMAVVVNSTNAGTVQFQFAQNTSDGGATTLYTNSFLIANRIA